MKLINKNERFIQEYCATIVQIGEVKPIEDSDFLAMTLVNGFPIVVRKDQVKEGDVMVYCPIETQINSQFLHVNNLYGIDCYSSNRNAYQVFDLIAGGKQDEAKKKCGFFNKHGRVKLIRLRGQASMGYLITIREMINYCEKLSRFNFEEHIGEDFNEVNGEEFIKVYIPPVKEGTPRTSRDSRRNKKLKKISRMIPGEFSFHYDTQQLNRSMDRFNPDTPVDISVKVHGTSICLGNVLVKKPKVFKNKFINKIHTMLPLKWQRIVEDYDLVYSSRTVIKNDDLNLDKGVGYYSSDVWGEYGKLLKPYIPQDMEIFGEIFGYETGTSRMIQKGYDYGCNVGENRLMIYRIRTKNEDCTHKEWNMKDIVEWVKGLKRVLENDGIENKIMLTPMLYSGTLKDLYPEISTETHWRENVLEALKNDKERFGMEMNEPMCFNVPREGIVIRISDDPVAEAFKLKCTLTLYHMHAQEAAEEFSTPAGNQPIVILGGDASADAHGIKDIALLHNLNGQVDKPIF